MSEETTVEREVITPEVMPKDALVLIEKSGVEQSTAIELRVTFSKMFGDAEKWLEQAKQINVTSVDQLRDMKLAREYRLALRQVRIELEKSRVQLKADALAKGKVIDAVANYLKVKIEAAESHLEDQEKFKERKEEQERNELRSARLQALSAWMDTTSMSYDVGIIPQDQFDMLLNGAKAKRESELAEIARIEKERIEAEEKARKEKEELEAKRVKELEEAKAKAIESERLRKEQEEKARKEREESEKKAREAQAKADAELKAMQAKADAERKERERIEREALEKARKEREEKEAKERAEKERLTKEQAEKEQAEKAPDKQKLAEFSKRVDALKNELPTMKSDAYKAHVETIKAQIEKMSAWILTLK